MTSTTLPLHRTIHRTVADVMSQDLMTIGPDATYREAVVILLNHRISGLPVVDGSGNLLGVVSEEDLLAKERHAEAPFLGALRATWRAEHARAEATLVRELMSWPALTLSFRASLPVAARTMARRRVRRLCVIDDAGTLIGIVTRGDLLRPFAREDAELREDVVTGVIHDVMSLNPRDFTVSVRDGIVAMRGSVERRTDVDILEHLARHVDGIVQVEMDVAWSVDDRHVAVGQFPPVL